MKKNTIFRFTAIFISIFIIISGLYLFNYRSSWTKRPHQIEKKNQEYDAFDSPEKFAEYHRFIRTNPTTGKVEYSPNYKSIELGKAIARKKALKSATEKLDWIERGPHNVGGRTWKLIIDPDDPTANTWFAGAAGGGIWKTTNCGVSWTNLTSDFPNLSIKTLVIDPTDSNILYAGTGDEISGIYGSGIFKSTDKGETWTKLESTNRFYYIKNIFINPSNSNQLYILANHSIYSSQNGGDSWQQIKTHCNDFSVHPDDFSVLLSYYFNKIERSDDGGSNWQTVYEINESIRKVTFSYAPGDHTDWFFIDDLSNLYISYDNGINWQSTVVTKGEKEPFLGDMGYFANTFCVDPSNPNQLYTGGVNISSIKISNESDEYGANTSTSFVNTDSFVKSSKLQLASSDSITTSQIEVRFGPGYLQKAHRFTVNTSAPDDSLSLKYIYQDYIDVPFEIWDNTNNKQYMLSFYDYLNNGFYNNNHGDNYLIINNVEYSNTPETMIAVNGGCAYNQLGQLILYTVNSINTYENLPNSSLLFDLYCYKKKALDITTLTTWTQRDVANYVHADQLELQIDEKNGNPYRIIATNDGGVSYSDDKGITWTSPIDGFVTTQFYGVDKHPEKNKYLGGMQDNGSWISDIEPNENSKWNAVSGGDGFDVIWHPFESNKLLTTTYYNKINISKNEGNSYSTCVIPNKASAFGSPFFTDIGYSPAAPDQLFFVDYYGIYRSANFGENWVRTDLAHSATSRMPITVSEANPDIVLTATLFGEPNQGNIYDQCYFSTNKGVNFQKPESIPFNTSVVSGIATHPFLPETAYLLCSIKGRSKIQRTNDLGKSWEDLSGFENQYSSSNGFPDVGVYCLLVMPYNTNEIWVGTDIGLFISKDNGRNWEIADNGLPNVAIWDMKIRGDEIIVATHGRGVWSVQLDELSNILRNPVIHQIGQKPNGQTVLIYSYMSEYDSVHVLVNHQIKCSFTNTDKIISDTLFLQFEDIENSDTNVQLQAFKDSSSCFSGTMSFKYNSLLQAVTKYVNDFETDSDDFILENFTISSYGNFPGKAAHTKHPYPSYEDCILQLKVPIIVTADKNGEALLKYSDIPMVTMSYFTESDGETIHKDFLIVEGSKDGLTWTPISEEYNFLNIIDNAQENGVIWASYEPIYEIIEECEYNLLDVFMENDTILIRFRLSSDCNLSDYNYFWGWMIDDLKIQENLTDAPYGWKNNKEISLQVFPNPTSGRTTIQGLPTNKINKILLFNSSGNIIQTQEFYGSDYKLNMTNCKAGTYYIKIVGNDSAIKIIKQ